MKKAAVRAAAIAVLPLLLTVPALAHHALAALVDTSKTVAVTGVVDQINWVNPHIYIYLNVTDDKGEVTRWALESLPPAMMARGNIKRDAIKIGEKVTASGFRAADRPLMWPLKLTFDGGRVLQLMDENKLPER